MAHPVIDSILEKLAKKEAEHDAAQCRVYALATEIDELKRDFNRANFEWIAKCIDSVATMPEVKYKHTQDEARKVALKLVDSWRQWKGYRLEKVSDDEWRLYDLNRPDRAPDMLVVMPNPDYVGVTNYDVDAFYPD